MRIYLIYEVNSLEKEGIQVMRIKKISYRSYFKNLLILFLYQIHSFE